jgi:hypothetical protein
LGICSLSKHWSYVKRSHVLTSPVKFILCGLSRFQKIVAICCLRQGPAAQTVRSSNTLFLQGERKVASFLTEVTAIRSRIVTYAAVVTFKTKKINKNQLRLIRLSKKSATKRTQPLTGTRSLIQIRPMFAICVCVCGMHSIVSAKRLDIILQITHECCVHVLNCAYPPLLCLYR